MPGKTIPFSSTCEFQFSSVAQSCLTLCDPVDCSMPGFPVCHQLPELAKTHVHQVNDAIQPSHRLSSSSAFSLSQHQGLFQGVSFLHQVAKLLEFQLLYQSFQLILRTIPLGLTGWISLQFKGLLRVFSSTTVQKHQFFGAQLSFGPTLTSIELMMPSSHLSSIVPFSSCLQSFPASGSFPRSQFFSSGGPSIGVLASASLFFILNFF